MKLYRQEVTPKVDLLLDLSASMFLTPAKAMRTWELVYFCLESALRLGAAVRIHALGRDAVDVPLERALAHDWPGGEVSTNPNVKADVAGMLERCPLRAGSLRVLVSDLLSETPPERMMNALLHGKGRALVFAPFCIEEAHPPGTATSSSKSASRPFATSGAWTRTSSSATSGRTRCTSPSGVSRPCAVGRAWPGWRQSSLPGCLRAEALSAGVVEMG